MSIHINALVTEVGVNLGDHGQDITRAVHLDPNMTVNDMCEEYLADDKWEIGKKYLTIRIAKDATND